MARELIESRLGRAVVVAASFILILVLVLFAISYLVSALLGLPSSLNLPPVVRIIGGVTVVAGLATMGWVFSYRSPVVMITSTYVTFLKLFRRVPVADRSGRTEPLVVAGPQKYVRNPLYFGVVVMVFGWALVGGYTFVFVATLMILLWFRFVIIPFEEKELLVLFGERYAKYASEVPMLVPFTRRKRRVGASYR